jgi:hypothetical protein
MVALTSTSVVVYRPAIRPLVWVMVQAVCRLLRGTVATTPWTHQLNLALTYVPAWGNKHLTFQAQVHNVFNEQNATLLVSGYMETVTNGAGVYSPVYKTPVALETPRYVDFSVKFDW